MRHKVYCYFMHNKGWQCQFLKEDLMTSAAKPITFDDPSTIVTMAERGHALKDLASRQALDFALNMGRGSVWLYLDDDQYAKLREAR